MIPREGNIPFKRPDISKPCEIWYKITGQWPPSSRPLVTLHGGPGYTHDYMLPLEDLAKAPFERTVIFFDQLGSGKSTHLQEKLLNHSFWSEQFFLDQVTAVLQHLEIQDCYDLLGHSWGGMLATIHAARQPAGLDRLIIAHAPAASEFWREKYNEFREAMPEPYRKTLKQPFADGCPQDPEYTKAIQEFYKRHFIKVDPIPEELTRSWNEIEADPTATLSTLGPDEFNMTGSMAAFTAVDDVKNIRARTLVVTGVDEGSDHEASIKVFKQIPDCTHMVFKHSTHFAHFEERPLFMQKVAGFLAN